MTKAEMDEKVKFHQSEIARLEAEKEGIDSLLENNQYKDHDDAEGAIDERFRSVAFEACQGAYNYGDDQYTQRYQVADDPAIYEATVKIEYNRHDKMYYYIDGVDYSYKVVSG